MTNSLRDVAWRAFVWGTWLVLGLVILQMLLAGLGVFTYAGFFFWHASVNGALVFFVPLLLILAGWYGRVPVRLRWLMAAIPVLTVLQSLLLIPYRMNAPGILRGISALHVVNAILIFWVALQIVERTRLYISSPPGTEKVGS
jgi:hypothetical protein